MAWRAKLKPHLGAGMAANISAKAQYEGKYIHRHLSLLQLATTAPARSFNTKVQPANSPKLRRNTPARLRKTSQRSLFLSCV